MPQSGAGGDADCQMTPPVSRYLQILVLMMPDLKGEVWEGFSDASPSEYPDSRQSYPCHKEKPFGCPAG